MGFTAAGIASSRRVKGFSVWLSRLQNLGLLVGAPLSSHPSLFCIVLSTTELGHEAFFPESSDRAQSIYCLVKSLFVKEELIFSSVVSVE